ncbi:transmembrane protein C1orf162 homolog isoform X4 [Myotis myotis]|uniref:transmembrane protein C1orf162 homolog isoform X4 n=1 Tax=Myotis myotis TaxID=51298 RepID=UPI00174E65CD|nr:transmembrane protein C1orf162 homolog isoform X4 [Myotis myotis]
MIEVKSLSGKRYSGDKWRNWPSTEGELFPLKLASKELHLALAFLAGSLLTLLLMALVFFIIKSYRKYHSSPHALDPHSDSLAKLSSNPEEALTSASMALKTSKEKRDDLNANHSADLNSVIYAQIKLADSS